MAKLVEEAQNNKLKTQRYIDRIAKYYTPAVCVIAGCLAGIPAAMRVHDLQKWFHLAVVILVSEVVISFLTGGDDPYDDIVVLNKLFHPNLKLLSILCGN